MHGNMDARKIMSLINSLNFPYRKETKKIFILNNTPNLFIQL